MAMVGCKRKRIGGGEVSISEALPEELLLHMFSCFFTSRELAATVLLVSKRWHRLGQSCLAILDYTLLKRNSQHLLQFVKNKPIRILKVQFGSRQGDQQQQHLMESLADVNFSELFLHSVNSILPLVFNNSSSLTVLHLTASQFPCFSHIPTLFSLQHLLLYDVVFQQHQHDFFLNLSIKCPSLLELTLTNCCIQCDSIDLPAHSFNKLKKLWVHNTYSKYSLAGGYSYKLQRLSIAGAQNLESFHLYYNGKNQLDLDIGPQCRPQLHSFHLQCENFPARFHTTNISSTFPNLKTLFIYLSRPLSDNDDDSLHIASDHLQSLTIWNKDDLFIPVHICTPNLRTFTYVGGGGGGGILEDFAPLDASSVGETRIELSSSKTSNVDWFLKLRSFIAKFSNDTILCLSIYEMTWFHLYNIDDLGIHLPCPIKKMKLRLCQSLPQKHCKSLLDGLLWTFHPEILEFGSNINFELVLHKELDYMVSKQHCCKPTLAHRCWRHSLKDFKIVRSNSTKRNEPKYFTILFKW